LTACPPINIWSAPWWIILTEMCLLSSWDWDIDWSLWY